MIILFKKIIEEYINRKFVLKFVKNLNQIFKKNFYSNQNVILVEVNQLRDCHIMYAYFCNLLAQKYQASIHGYFPKYFNGIYNYFFFFIKFIFNLDYVKVFRSFNTKKFIVPKKKFKNKAILQSRKLYESLISKSDIYKLEINKINIGDLLYDAYLRKFNEPTIIINDKKFINFLNEFVNLFLFWFNFFEKKKVKSVILSDVVYEFGIIAYIAYHRNIPVYNCSTMRILKLDKNNKKLFQTKNFSKEFDDFSQKQKRIKRKLGKKFLEKRFRGEVGIENKLTNLPINSYYAKYSSQSSFLLNNEKPNCIIAAHHFSDAPNIYGRLLFDDFYDWVDFLGNLSERLDYNWYLKFHPLDHEFNLKFSEYFTNRYKKFNLIPPKVSIEHLIKNEKVDLVLTCYGTVGLECAYWKIPVINASINNPHICYNFNAHPKNVTELEDFITNYKKLNLDYSRDQLYEYYYMSYLSNFYFYDDELYNHEAISDQSVRSYNRWLDYFNNKRVSYLKKKISAFIDTNDFRMRRDLKYLNKNNKKLLNN